MHTRSDTIQPPGKPRRAWQRPAVLPAGTLGDLVQFGTGKVTVVTGDPGEPQKVPATDK